MFKHSIVFILFTLFGLLVGTLIPTPNVFDPSPYNNVRVLEGYQDEGIHYIDFAFDKTDCQFHSLDVFGLSFGIFDPLEWHNTDPTTGNRPVGEQLLDMVIDPDGVTYSHIEIRTQHFCGEDLVEKTFYSYIPYELQPLEE